MSFLFVWNWKMLPSLQEGYTSHTLKNNYSHDSILPILPTVWTTEQQTDTRFFKSILSKFQCGFRKSYGDGHYLLTILKTWKETTDSYKSFAAFLTGLSKAFDCSSHDLLIAKLQACGLDLASLNIPCRLLDKQKTNNTSRFTL